MSARTFIYKYDKTTISVSPNYTTIFNNILFRTWLWVDQQNISVILLEQTKKGSELLDIWIDLTRKLNKSLYNDAIVH